MTSLQELSGPWSGFYIQYGYRGCMRLRLTFATSSVTGTGSDSIGRFSVIGSCREDGFVSMIKRYATHDVFYSGRWDGVVLAGTWSLVDEGFSEFGPFELWPEDGEVSLKNLEVEELQLVG